MKGLFTFLLLLAFVSGCGLADLRNDILKSQEIPEEIQSRAREILKNPIHPDLDPSLWNETRSIQVFLVDYWNSGFVRFFTPVPEKVQAMKVNLSFHRNIVHIQFTDGKQRGRIFGVEEGEPYTYNSRDGRIFTKDSDIQNYAESLRLYILFPFQVHSYKNVAYLGEMNIGNQEYHEIFATNGNWEVSDEFDQYKVYIKKDSGEIEFVQFTYRDVFSFYKGILHYEDYTLYNGRLIPMKIGIKSDFMDEKYIHQLQIGSIKYFTEDLNWED